MNQLPLPMTPAQLITNVLDPAFEWLPERMDSAGARVMMIAMALQESMLAYRRQMGNGPAKGLWQNERGGGVLGSLSHPASKHHMQRLCEEFEVSFDSTSVWNRLETDDVFAAIQSRLLLWTDAQALPPIHDQNAAWRLYMRVWRPGKPHPDKWPENHARAVRALGLA